LKGGSIWLIERRLVIRERERKSRDGKVMEKAGLKQKELGSMN
jgi:hypothetical protein